MTPRRVRSCDRFALGSKDRDDGNISDDTLKRSGSRRNLAFDPQAIDLMLHESRDEETVYRQRSHSIRD